VNQVVSSRRLHTDLLNSIRLLQAGLELLQQGVQGLVDAVERLIPDISSIAIDAE